MAENDAKWLAENVILPQYNDLKDEMKKVQKCNFKLKMQNKDLEHTVTDLTKKITQLTENMDILVHVVRSHTKDKKRHYVPHHSESAYERFKRKRKEYAAIIAATTLLMTTVLAVIEALTDAGVL